MTAGLQAFAPNGELLVEVTDRFCRLLGSGAFSCPNYGAYTDVGVGGLINSGDFFVTATGGGYIEYGVNLFRYRVGPGANPGDTIFWTAYTR